MTDIKLINEGGKIVAKDIDTGETVPIDLGETEADALSADDLTIKVSPDGSDIESTIESAPDGAVIQLPEGEFEIDNPINITTDIKVSGAGMFHGTKLSKTNDDYGIQIGDCIPTLEDLWITSGISDTSPGIHSTADSTSAIYMHRVRSTDHGSHGFHLESCNIGGFYDLYASYNGGDGFRSGGVDANAYTLSNLNIRSNDGHGYNNTGSYGPTVSGGYSTNNGKYGWRIDNNEGHYWGLAGEANTNELVLLDSNADANLVVIGASAGGDAVFNSGNEENTVLRQTTSGLEVRGPTAKFLFDDNNGNPSTALRSHATSQRLDFGNGFELTRIGSEQMIIPEVSAQPTNPQDGAIWYRTDLDEYRGAENGSVVSFDTTIV